jgi:hypothetical protein
MQGWVPLAVMFLLSTGCQELQSGSETAGQSEQKTLIEQVRISTLTGFETDPAQPETVQLNVCVELLNASGLQFPMPCIFRFELYAFQALSSDPRGQRLIIWPDQDLRSDQSNSAHWKDYLKGYQFSLPVDITPEPKEQYVLEATCMIGQRRYSDLIRLSP